MDFETEVKLTIYKMIAQDAVVPDSASIAAKMNVPEVKIGEEEMARRKADWVPPADRYPRSYTRMYIEHVTQANGGCDRSPQGTHVLWAGNHFNFSLGYIR